MAALAAVHDNRFMTLMLREGYGVPLRRIRTPLEAPNQSQYADKLRSFQVGRDTEFAQEEFPI